MLLLLAFIDYFVFGDESMFLYNIMIVFDKREIGGSDLDLLVDK